MRVIPFLFAFALASGASASPWAVDLTKIDRTIAKEPAYRSKPKYCLLVFGPEAKTRVWLVLDGDAMYVDRNSNGNLTDEGDRIECRKNEWDSPPIFEHFFNAGDIADSDGKTAYGTLLVQFWGRNQALHENKCLIRIGAQEVGNHTFFFSDRADKASIIHFAGPLTLTLVGPPHFIRGQEPRHWSLKDSANWLQVRVGTPGLGNGTFAEFDGSHVETWKDLHVLAAIDFPCKDGSTKRIGLKLPFDK